ncbi:Minor pilin of type IV secretion complex, VirB5 [Candidatus Burkholderia verschuerenii]|uniref:Minor pilin of type IV secretion complex, VirB5 n=1 Tax=Candidatus Burkholderia verschuerenii TaxID=242163 RepID=A0A0L0MGU7_9BURK|nr:type IV secretion system protein [Candidatus Burkholderia verschuerenii]KND61520.1 Minor pilin of type IV secretion complex, VirB5 [Candidatus Burkholderia verschuerenii]
MKIRKVILAGVTTLAIVGGSIGPANAQRAVIDIHAIGQAIQQLKQLQQQYHVLQQQYSTMNQQYQAIAHAPQNALTQLGSQFNVPQFRSPLSAGSADVGSIMNGTGSGSGALSSNVQAYLNQNRVYSPSGQDFQAQQMHRNATSIAGSQAMAADLYQSAANHIQTLQSLEGQLSSAPDAKAVADIQARIGMEQAAFQAQQVQVQSLAMWQAAQERNEQQREDESRRQQLDSGLQQIRAHGG